MTNFVQEGLNESEVRQYLLDEYGKEAFLESGEPRVDILKSAIKSIDSEENPQLEQALRLELSLGARDQTGSGTRELLENG